MDATQYYKRQISLTEWFEQIRHAKTKEMRMEDNEKRERLRVLHEIIGLRYDEPTQFSAADIAHETPLFLTFLIERGDKHCALRLIPLDHAHPKLRIRGKTVRGAVEWFKEQNVPLDAYRADFMPHSENSICSTIFIVNPQGIFGEFAWGQHNILTQGFYEAGGEPITFAFQWDRMTLSRDDAGAQTRIEEFVASLKVSDQGLRTRLQESLDAEFTHDYLCGYFETVTTEEYGTWFIDYNRILAQQYKDFVPQIHVRPSQDGVISGIIANRGSARGKVRIVIEDHLADKEFDEGDILVCGMTSPLYIPLIQKAGAIVTDRGGMLSHAAIVSRELGKPCITATKNATKILQDGEMVEVDADKGTVTRLR